MDSRTTGPFIAELRKQKGYTQRELAEKLMVTDKAVSRWETGRGLPDTSLLNALSDILGVSVSELLAGERIEEEHIKERTDRIILDSLKYSRRMLINMINIVLIVIGGVLILLPIFIGGGNSYRVLGAVLVLFALLRVYLNKRKISIQNSNMVIYGFALLCQLTVLILEILPYGVVMIFAPGPNERLIRTFSYFSLVPFGYGELSPLSTGILTIAVVLLCGISLIKKLRAMKLQNAAFICSIFAIALSLMPLLWDSKCMSAVSYTISALMLISIVLQAVANRNLESTR